LSPPPAAAAGAVDAVVEGEADGGVLALADATAEAAGLADTDGDADTFGLSESAWVAVAGGLLATGGAPDFELLLHADAPNARTMMVAVATRALGRIATPNSGRGRAPRCLKPSRRP